ncbi:MAG: phosphoribosylglycinamide formyltransferase [Acidobacteriota bacterium]
MKRVGILISGRGSNMVALLEAMERGEVPARCALVLSNAPEAPGLASAAERGVPTAVVDHKLSATREEHDAKVIASLREAGAEIVCLAGYMRLLSPLFVRAFPNRILNIHPALLPAFPGLHVQRKAIEHGARFSGCTVHVVDEECDHGPIVLQAVVPVLPGDTEESLSTRILRYEHRTYPAALRLMCEEKVVIEGRRTRLLLSSEEYIQLLSALMDRGD